MQILNLDVNVKTKDFWNDNDSKWDSQCNIRTCECKYMQMIKECYINLNANVKTKDSWKNNDPFFVPTILELVLLIHLHINTSVLSRNDS